MYVRFFIFAENIEKSRKTAGAIRRKSQKSVILLTGKKGKKKKEKRNEVTQIRRARQSKRRHPQPKNKRAKEALINAEANSLTS
jgi:hypothetical protein